jgi:Carboxypeptidase regulatory-like domain/TonB-dependent Receptor Plug Domain
LLGNSFGEAFLVRFTQLLSNVLCNRRKNISKTSMRTAVTHRIVACLLSALIGAGVAHAQNSNATIRGQVLDPSGALVANAQVMIVNQQTRVTVFNGHTDSAGAFVASQVIPGVYEVTVSASGLKRKVVNNVVATVAQVESLNISMELGQVSEVVTVESKGETIERSTSNVSTLISPQEVQNLPLFNRSPENLLAFIPGVTYGGSATQPNTSQLSINGSRTLNSDVLLNGVSTTIASTGTSATLPSPDGIDALRFLTSTAPAEYGRTAGAVLAANTKSGTNTFHGNAYLLARNSATDANSYFNNLKGLPRQATHYYQVGGSLGGPVWIPHVYNGRQKTFFFVNYDRTLQKVPQTVTSTVPDAATRSGNFSASPQPVFMPGGTKTAQFPGNVIPSGMIDPAAAKILALLPLPNSPGTFDKANNRFTNNYVAQQTSNLDALRLVARVDQQQTGKDLIHVSLFRNSSSQPNPLTYLTAPLLNTTWDCSCSNAWITSIDYTRVWSPTLVMDLNMGFFRNAVFRNPPGVAPNVSQTIGIATLPLTQVPQLTYNGYTNIGADTNTDQVNITNTFTPFGTITKVLGPHTFKFGASLRKNQFNSFNPSGSPEGTLNFDGSITNHGNSGNATTGLADFLLGKIKTGNYQLPMPPTGRRNYNIGAFFQDDYKVTRRLTINAGVRYEYESPLTIANNIYTRFDPATGNLLAAGINSSNSLNIDTPKVNLSPRVGLAYGLNDKTVFRAAFGTFYGPIFQNLGGQVAFPGYDVTDSYNNLGTAVPQPFSLSQGFVLGAVRDLSNPFAALNNASPSTPFTIPGVEFNGLSKLTMMEQWNAGIQRELPLALTLEVNFVGNRGLHLPLNIPTNVVPLSQVDAVTLANNTKTTQLARLFPNLGSWTLVNDVGNSWYDSLQVSVRRQFNTRLAILSNYTYSKSIDDGSTVYNFSAPQGTANAQYTADSALREADRAVSDLDQKHKLNIAMVYTSRGPWWLRDWKISPVFVGATGLPVNITQTNEITNVSQQRPNGDTRGLVLAQPTVVGTAIQYLIPASAANFPLTPSGPVYSTINGVRTRIVPTGFGNVPRDSVRAPGVIAFDASISKEFPLIKELLRFQFRVDAFNLLNHTNFNAPNGSLSVSTSGTNATFATNSSGFGQITGAQPPRQLQLVGKFIF